MNYKAPISGTYSVKTHFVKFIPTGEFETVNNENRKWWQMWKPKTVTRQKFLREVVELAPAYVTMNEGDDVGTRLFIERIASDK
jgi:hypothetical protein